MKHGRLKRVKYGRVTVIPGRRRTEPPPNRSFFVRGPIYADGVPEPVDLKPATPEDIAEALAFALRYSGRKQVRDSGALF